MSIMDIEDPEVSMARYHDRYMATLRGQYEAGKMDGVAESQQKIQEQSQALQEKDQALQEKDQALQEKDQEIEKLREEIRKMKESPAGNV